LLRNFLIGAYGAGCNYFLPARVTSARKNNSKKSLKKLKPDLPVR
jgi:hypothetical protein